MIPSQIFLLSPDSGLDLWETPSLRNFYLSPGIITSKAYDSLFPPAPKFYSLYIYAYKLHIRNFLIHILNNLRICYILKMTPPLNIGFHTKYTTLTIYPLTKSFIPIISLLNIPLDSFFPFLFPKHHVYKLLIRNQPISISITK